MILLGIFAVFLALGEGPIYSINGSIDVTEKNFPTDFSKVNTKFLLSAHYHSDKSYLFVNGKEIFKFKAQHKNVNFPTLSNSCCLESISNQFGATESGEVYLKGNGNDFLLDYNVIYKSDMLNIHKCFILRKI